MREGKPSTTKSDWLRFVASRRTGQTWQKVGHHSEGSNLHHQQSTALTQQRHRQKTTGGTTNTKHIGVHTCKTPNLGARTERRLLFCKKRRRIIREHDRVHACTLRVSVYTPVYQNTAFRRTTIRIQNYTTNYSAYSSINLFSVCSPFSSSSRSVERFFAATLSLSFSLSHVLNSTFREEGGKGRASPHGYQERTDREDALDAPTTPHPNHKQASTSVFSQHL